MHPQEYCKSEIKLTTACRLSCAVAVSCGMRIFIMGLLLLRLCLVLQAQPARNVFFSHISAREGFTADEIADIYQDSRGFIWIASLNGLYKYDGNRFILYKTNELNDFSADYESVIRIREDRKGMLWLITSGGLRLFDPAEEIFSTPFLSGTSSVNQPNTFSNCLEIDESGRIWTGAATGLICITPGKDSNPYDSCQLNLFPAKTAEGTLTAVTQLADRDSVFLWAGTSEGLYLFNKKNKAFIRVNRAIGGPKPGLNAEIKAILPCGDDELWIATSTGLMQFRNLNASLPNNTFLSGITVLRYDGILKKKNITVTSMTRDLNNDIWLGTIEDGLMKMIRPKKKKDLSFVSYRTDMNNPRAIGCMQISCLFTDREGTLWVGQATGGISKTTTRGSCFNSFTDLARYAFSSPDVSYIGKGTDGQDDIMIGTFGGGIYKVKAKDQKSEKINYTHSTGGELLVTAMVRDKEGIYWIGTKEQGLFQYNGKTNSVKAVLPESPGSRNLSDAFIRCLLRIPGYLLIGTGGKGLLSYSIRENRLFACNIPSDSLKKRSNTVYCMLRTRKKEIWLGTTTGLIKLIHREDAEGPSFDFITSERGKLFVGNLWIFTMAEDAHGIIWLGTKKGLVRFDPVSLSYVQYTANADCNSMYSVQPDNNGSVWCGTPAGLYRYNAIENRFRIYTADESMPLQVHSIAATYQDKKGMIYFGGSEGFYSFHPDSFAAVKTIPRAAITGFRLLNAVDGKMARNKIIPCHISYTGKVKLRHNQNDLAIDFALLSYTNPLQNRLMFMLEGAQNEWISAGPGNNSVVYTNLTPGHYIFRVRGTNPNGFESMEDVTLAILISPPWWRTTIAYGAYGILLLLAVYLYTRWRTWSYKKDKHVLEKQVQERTMELFHQKEELKTTLDHLKATQAQLIQSEKMASLGQLIAGIAHEINSPLGVIKASIGSMEDAAARSLNELPALMKKLDNSQLAIFLNMINRSAGYTAPVTSKEERLYKKELTRQLVAAAIPDAEYCADLLVDMGLYEGVEEYFDMLRVTHPSALPAAYFLAQQARSSRNIMTAVDRASKIVFALKNYSHTGMDEAKVKADIARGLDTVLTLYHNQLKHGIILVKQFEPLPEIFCYPDELNQVWTNLITNAVHAMNGKGTLTLKLSKNQQYAVIEISDTGNGIPGDIGPRIFDAFFTTKAAGEGSGLGLYIVKQIIDKHEGNITYRSQPGEGSTFTVCIPLLTG